MKFYPAIITKDEGGVFLAQAIDLENVFSEGATIEEAIAHAGDALAGVLDVMTEHGDKIPEPTPIDVAEVNRTKKIYGDIVALVYLKAPPPKARAVKISVTMDEELLKRIDSIVGNYGRSEFLANASREKIARENTVDIPMLDPASIRGRQMVQVKLPKHYIDDLQSGRSPGAFRAKLVESASGGAPRLVLEPIEKTG